MKRSLAASIVLPGKTAIYIKLESMIFQLMPVRTGGFFAVKAMI
jgi:hypothetical protein